MHQQLVVAAFAQHSVRCKECWVSDALGAAHAQVLKSVDWKKVHMTLVEVAVHDEAHHNEVAAYMELQVSEGVGSESASMKRLQLFTGG